MGAVSFKVGRPGQGVNTLATAGFSDLVDLKVGTSLAKAGNVLIIVFIFMVVKIPVFRKKLVKRSQF